MNRQRFFRFIVLSAVIVLISSGLFFAQVQGIKVSLTGSGNTVTKTTGSSGEVLFDKLQPGDYSITFVRQIKGNTPSFKKSQSGTVDPLVENHNSSRSNRGSSIGQGNTVEEVNITLIKGGPQTPDASIVVTIVQNGDKIKVRFNIEVLPAPAQ